MKKSGQCLCGGVKITLDEVPGKVGACHCGMCRRWTGSVFMSVPAQPGKITIAGEENLKAYASSPWAERVFCRECGTGLFYRVTAPGKYHGVRYVSVGLFDDPSGLQLESEIFYDRRSKVFEFAGDLEQKTEAEVMAEFAG